MKQLLINASLFAIAAHAGAAVLTTLPTPMNQGGMIHLNVALKGTAITVDPEPGMPVIQGLSAWKPGDTFDSAAPWYATLDPTQGAGFFNSQFGMVLYDSDELPIGSKIMVGWVSGTSGLKTYQWRNTTSQMFVGILGTSGSTASWDWGSVAHGMMHPMFVMPAGSSGSASATLSFTLVDETGAPLAGFTPAQTTVDFSVVPEPSAVLLCSIAGLLVMRRKRSESSHS